MTRPTDVGHHQELGARWEFNESVASVFDDMLGRSIPEYAEMRRATAEYGSMIIDRYLETSGEAAPAQILDLGSSNGGALAPLLARYGPRARYSAVEMSDPMRADLEARFQDHIPDLVQTFNTDLRYDFPSVPPLALTQSILTLMFIPIEYRQHVVRHVYDALVPEGALLLVEKVLASNAHLDRWMTDAYYAMKARMGYSHEEIDRKRFALEGVQVPITAEWNEQLLRNEGFRFVDCYWRSGKFAAWIAIK